MTTTPNGSTPAGGQHGQNPQYGGDRQAYPQQGYAPNGSLHQGYPQNGYPQQGQQWVPQEPPQKKNFFVRHKIFTGLLALAVLIGLGSALGGGGKKDDAKSSTSASGDAKAGSKGGDTSDETPAALPAIGKPVTDGKFTFTVTRVERNVPSIGGEYSNKKAQGAYTLVHVTVKNTGTETQSLSADDQKAYDTQGIGYKATSDGAIYIEGNDTLYTEINPGNTLKGILVFDAPKGTKLTKVRLHDSMFSNGVEASL